MYFKGTPLHCMQAFVKCTFFPHKGLHGWQKFMVYTVVFFVLSHLCACFLQENPLMHQGYPCKQVYPEEFFKDGITNGAEWYNVPGEHWSQVKTTWMFDVVYLYLAWICSVNLFEINVVKQQSKLFAEFLWTRPIHILTLTLKKQTN